MFARGRPEASDLLTDDRCGEVPDEELLRLIAGGNRDAFVALYRRHQDTVHRFAFQMSGSRTVAEDITQDTFLELSRGAQRYNPSKAEFSTYLYGVVRHLVRRRLRRDRVLVALTGDIASRWKAREPTVEHSLVEAASQQQTVERVRRAVVSLPPRYREVVVLCNLHGRDYAEAAAIVGCAIGTIRSRLHRARDLLRQKLAHPDEATGGAWSTHPVLQKRNHDH